MIGTMLGCFQGPEVPGKIQQGTAWWFNDTKAGMEAQLTSIANLSVLGNILGMLTDSRSFLSYTRHEYYRRILCNWLGNLVEIWFYPYLGGVGLERDDDAGGHLQEVDILFLPASEADEVHPLVGVGRVGENFADDGKVGRFGVADALFLGREGQTCQDQDPANDDLFHKDKYTIIPAK
jgi:hypothetical protein